MFNLFPFSTWQQFSPILTRHVTRPLHIGRFTSSEAKKKSLRLAEGCQGHYAMGHYIYLYWLIDLEQGFVIDAKFQTFGSPILTGVGNFLCENLIGKSYAEGRKFDFETIKNHLNISDQLSKTTLVRPYINLCLDALDDIIFQCIDLPCNSDLASLSSTAEEPMSSLSEENWNKLSKEERLNLLNKTFSTHIESFLHLDGGGAVIEDIDDNHTVFLSYFGNCSGCFSAVGTTLSSIEHVFQTYVFHKIKIKINEDSLNFNPFDQ